MARKAGGKLKKTLLISCILLILITFCGCVIATDFYSGKRPYDYGKATWVCESPDAWFIVNTSEDDENFIYPKGEIAIGNKTVEFTLSFGHGKEASFTDENDDVILLGTCKFSSEKLIVTVDKEKDVILNGQYDTITFVRKPIK
jgi:hypothetical protein